jgi:hypothetical protein
VSHRDEAESLRFSVLEAAKAHEQALRVRNEAIRRAREDKVSPTALGQWYDLSPEQIRRICQEGA